MYITLNDEKIVLNFNPYPTLKISGPDPYYLIELREFKKNEDQSLHLESYQISNGIDRGWRQFFDCPIEFYCDYEISIFKYISNYGIKKIFTHRFNDYGKKVLFNLDTDDYDECLLWIDRVNEYQRIHGCKSIINTKFEDLNKKLPNYYLTYGIDHYKTYNIGRYPKTSKDYKTVDHRKEGVIWYGNWKTFWSYQHPRLWKNLSSQEIVDDILGL
jgi:hypothetical protein